MGILAANIGAGALQGFSFSKMNLVKVYSELDAERLSNVLKSSLYFQKREALLVK